MTKIPELPIRFVKGLNKLQHPGDIVRIEIKSIGKLTNPVALKPVT